MTNYRHGDKQTRTEGQHHIYVSKTSKGQLLNFIQVFPHKMLYKLIIVEKQNRSLCFIRTMDVDTTALICSSCVGHEHPRMEIPPTSPLMAAVYPPADGPEGGLA